MRKNIAEWLDGQGYPEISSELRERDLQNLGKSAKLELERWEEIRDVQHLKGDPLTVGLTAAVQFPGKQVIFDLEFQFLIGICGECFLRVQAELGWAPTQDMASRICAVAQMNLMKGWLVADETGVTRYDCCMRLDNGYLSPNEIHIIVREVMSAALTVRNHSMV